MSSRNGGERTTLGHLRYMFAPIEPYFTADESLGRRGNSNFVEFPVTVLPFFRLPFFATFTLATGLALFKASYNLLKSLSVPIQYQFHLSDFVDYTHPDFANQVPPDREGQYVPYALRLPLEQKLAFFTEVMETLACGYRFITLAEWSMLGKEAFII